MAITLADFNKIWASTSPLTPYSFSESNYKQGWNFIGSTPPARQMWDFLQKQNDEKMQYLANNYLPLTGGTLTGTVVGSYSGNHQMFCYQDGRITKGQNPSNDLYHPMFCVTDKNGTGEVNRLGGIEHYLDTNGTSRMYLRAYRNESGALANASIIVGFNSDGKTFSTAPNPPNDSNSDNIATTSWVNTKLESYLPLSGGTMTGGFNTSAKHFYIKHTQDVIDGQMCISGGNGENYSGGVLYLYGSASSNRPGHFLLSAEANNVYSALEGKPDGTLTWGGNNVITSAGGTFTGDIVRESTTSNDNFRIQRTDITKNTAPTETKYVTASVSNANGGRLSITELTLETNKLIRNDFRVYSFQGSGSTALSVGYDSNNVAYAFVSSIFYPIHDNVFDLGNAYHRWKQLYAGTTTIATSDERLKDNIEPIPDDVLDAWGEVNWYQYQFKDSIAEKGENARIHTGAIAQRIESVFESHGLYANRYGLLCYDEWEAEEEQKDSDGNIVQEAREAGNRYSLRYEEALCMEAAYQRRRADRLEERIEALEKLLMNRTE